MSKYFTRKKVFLYFLLLLWLPAFITGWFRDSHNLYSLIIFSFIFWLIFIAGPGEISLSKVTKFTKNDLKKAGKYYLISFLIPFIPILISFLVDERVEFTLFVIIGAGFAAFAFTAWFWLMWFIVVFLIEAVRRTFK